MYLCGWISKRAATRVQTGQRCEVEERRPKSVDKPGSVVDGHLSRTAITRRLKQPTRDSNGTGRPLPLLGLTPGGGCQAARVTTGAGGLLHHLFTITGAADALAPNCPGCLPFCGPSPSGNAPFGAPRLDVIQLRTLWSPDFPRPLKGRDRQTDLGLTYHNHIRNTPAVKKRPLSRILNSHPRNHSSTV